MLALALLVVTATFTPNQELASRMQPIAGKDITVYCPASEADWQEYVRSLNGPASASGYTPVVGGTETYLSYSMCDALVRRVSGRSMTVTEISRPLFVLTHEVQHLRGIESERDADCAAIGLIPQSARAFGFRNQKKTARLVSLARFYHAQKPPPYNGPC